MGVDWHPLLTVSGEKGRIEARIPGPIRLAADRETHHAEIGIADRSTGLEATETIAVDEDILLAGDHHGSTYYQHKKFFELVRSGKGEAEVSLEDGLWSVVIGEAAEESAKTGRAFDVSI